jgi:large subunit ribosomal protein L46
LDLIFDDWSSRYAFETRASDIIWAEGSLIRHLLTHNLDHEMFSRSLVAQSRSLATHAPTTVVANVVARSPRISRTPTPFEKSFYQYQQRIARALHNPFPHEFYFKQGAPLESQFNIEERKREQDAFGTVSKFMMDMTEANLEAAELAKEEIEPSASRITEADTTNDLHSLDRQGERNLYLLLKNQDEKWSFPQRQVQKGEIMHQVSILCSNA